ncbi:hypothetical protein SADO_12728 [Salinisphaera dokdonensis CL-ES53]|uniref:ACP phosphodiesterase n=1 Tax=Salinisphaera dokdonensis CL-ES53 TaxID=1304272 RepID=A0ABV2B2L7_9GAMM
MNLLAHLLLADRSNTSFAGQILGDEIKGWLDDRFAPRTRHGIKLHRAIDRHSDDHALHRTLRQRFNPPLRRYAGIVVDIGLDHALARQWHRFHDESLPVFARRAQTRVITEWPDDAPFSADRLRGLSSVLVGYAQPEGIKRALDSVKRRLRRQNPVGDALPELLALNEAFDASIAPLLAELEQVVRELDSERK